MIDLRSDTVTRPSAAMRSAMAEAEVGDDVFGEDPTVRRLQEMVAALLGKEAALFVPSGTMANQLAIAAQTHHGDEVFLERQSHIFNYESGAPGLLSGVQLHVLDGTGGVIDPCLLDTSIRHGYYWEPRARLLCLENTINRVGGCVYPLESIDEVTAIARGKGLATHLDGARLWNASVASGIGEAEYAKYFDTVGVSLSKGLGAPVGSLLVGTNAVIERAHRYRKLFGGGMRQAGIIAAAGIYAIEHNRDRIADDHANATRLAAGLAAVSEFNVDPAAVQTNMFTFDCVHSDSATIVAAFRRHDILMHPWGPHRVRVVTHLDVSSEDADRVVAVAAEEFN